jgi:His/Glu/Gln/Arg/opine family amino acid ABC transporter permease subunit
MQFDDYLAIASGAGVTVAVSLLATAIGMPLGLVLALIRWRGRGLGAAVTGVAVSFLRATPSVTLVLLIYFAAPEIGVQIPAFPAAVLTLALGTMAYSAEIWRAALLAFPPEQYDAALAFGMTGFTRFRIVVLPQIFRASMPALVNEMTLLIKVSPAVAVIGLVEITRAAVRVGAETYEPLPPFMVALAIYVLIIACLVIAQRYIERRLRRQAAP